MKNASLKVLFALAVLSISSLGVPFVQLASANFMPPIQHNSGIFITSNGDVSPPNIHIQHAGDTYTFTGDVSGGIAVEKSGVTIDGNGYRLTGNGSGTGVLLQGVNNVTILNVQMQSFSRGIYISQSSRCTVNGNTLSGCGIESTTNSNSNHLTNNTIAGGGISLSGDNNNEVLNNQANSLSIVFSNDNIIKNNRIAADERVDVRLISYGGDGGLLISNSQNCSLYGNTVEREVIGVNIWFCTNLTFSFNTLRDNQVAFKVSGSDSALSTFSIDTTNTVNGRPVYYLVDKCDAQVPTYAGWIAAVDCLNITVKNYVSTPNWDSVLFVNTNASSILNCNLTGNFNAIMLIDSCNFVIQGNEISGNGYAAMYLDGAVNGTITENDVADNFCLFNIRHGSTGNTFFGNNFGGNWTGSFDRDFPNQWDKGQEGNYWSNYTGTDADGDGVGDTPFFVDPQVYSQETDNYPLMAPLNLTAGVHTQAAVGEMPSLFMPVEYLNYTIVAENGTLWAKIDGEYPMHMSENSGNVTLPMYYPTPPDTTNMHVWLDDAELSWSNYSEVDPSATHYTDIGDWQMIYCLVAPSADDFVLRIHYEHPVQVINGTYTFLYDLNIISYLSPESPVSTAHFNVFLEANCSGVNVYTTGFNGTWTPKSYETTTEGGVQAVSFDIVSEYNQPLLGDIVVTLENPAVPEFSAWTVLALLAAVFVAVVVLKKNRTLKLWAD